MLDEKDEKILDLLKGNARMSYEELGRELDMSRVAAKKRVRKLEEAGIIRGYNTCIYRDSEVTAFIDIVTTMDKFDEVLRYVATRTRWVRQIFCLYKENSIHMVVVAPAPDDLRYMARVIAKQDGVVELKCNAVSEVIKDVYGGIDKYGIQQTGSEPTEGTDEQKP